MLTQLGKELRILRIENAELLKDMALKLDLSPAYLSSIENGKRVPTEKFIQQLLSTYDLEKSVVDRIMTAYYDTIDEIKIDIKTEKAEQKELGLVFARKFNLLSDEQIEDIKKILCE
ncbi:MAG: helix-turn-helix domain-containing protein [Ruminococcus sp.]